MRGYSCHRVVSDSAVTYLLLLPAAQLLRAEPLIGVDVMPATDERLEVAVELPLTFDAIGPDAWRGIVSIGPGTRLGFDERLDGRVRHGLVAVRITAPLPETAWRLDERLAASPV
jgi:hypothetical protein